VKAQNSNCYKGVLLTIAHKDPLTTGTAINFRHDLLCPPHRVCYCIDCGRDSRTAIELRELPRRL